MSKLKYLSLVLLIVILAGCGQSEENKYFESANKIFPEFKTTVDDMVETLQLYHNDPAGNAELVQAESRVYSVSLNGYYEELKIMKAPIGWEDKHKELMDDVYFFKYYADEMINVTKMGDLTTLGILTTRFMSMIQDAYSIIEMYERQV